MVLLKKKDSRYHAENRSLIYTAGHLQPSLLQQKIIPLILKRKNIVVEASEGSGKTATFILPLVKLISKGKKGIKAVVITSNPDQVKRASRELLKYSERRNREFTFWAIAYKKSRPKQGARPGAFPDVLIGTPDKVIDNIRRGVLDFSHLQIAVIDAPHIDGQPGFNKDVFFIFSKFPQKIQTILFSPSLADRNYALISLLSHPHIIPVEKRQKQPDEVIKIEETNKVQNKKENLPINQEIAIQSIGKIVKRIKEEENPFELNHYRKLIKKNVPLSLRSYFSAYLFKESLAVNIGNKSNEFTRLFISIGKNRKIFPKDLVALFTTKLNLTKNQIGVVKVLDNYSFLEISSGVAERAISVLSGFNYKGKYISVNYARKKNNSSSSAS